MQSLSVSRLQQMCISLLNEVLFLILRLGVFKMNCAILHLQICVVKMQMFCICVVKYLNTYCMNEIFEGVFFFKSFNISFFINIHWCRNCRLDRNIHMSFHDKVCFWRIIMHFFVENKNLSTVLFDTYLYIVICFVTDLYHERNSRKKFIPNTCIVRINVIFMQYIGYFFCQYL